ncbi:hypothetical protein H1V43_32460 [Streptomyces sp. PSKA54]|uniref:Uncharacterized protein n=1 Tax=Streptomyces himalayensis subsp. aureolus TaxID=2758039 RepID=A0A7W2D750_9ACTN|nr:hypothetical protein [Streptomyces himalayensis]MBA4865977.1 hypothetical protein [Streptomyces himalayensis subsp. aureolus]
MNTRAVKAVEQVIHASMVKGKQTAAGYAIDLDSAQLIMSPEKAKRLAELEEMAARLLAMLPTKPLPKVMLGEGAALRAEYGAWVQVAMVLGVSLPYERPAAEKSADKLTRLFAPTQALREDEPEAPALTVYRASHDSIVFGYYATREAAREHCQKFMERENPVATLEWRPDGEWREDDDGEPGPDDTEELYAYGSHPETATWDPTGYVVTPIEVASAYDEEADE